MAVNVVCQGNGLDPIRTWEEAGVMGYANDELLALCEENIVGKPGELSVRARNRKVGETFCKFQSGERKSWLKRQLSRLKLWGGR